MSDPSVKVEMPLSNWKAIMHAMVHAQHETKPALWLPALSMLDNKLAQAVREMNAEINPE